MAVLKGRDVREYYKELGAEMGSLKVLELIIEELVGHRQAVVEMANQQSRMIDMLSVVSAGTAQLKAEIDTQERMRKQYENMETPE